MPRLEARPSPSRTFVLASPLIAIAVTIAIGVLLFVLLGKDPLLGLRMFFWEPIKSAYAWSEIGVKATPLLLIALGLALCFRANVWNIGAEGQYILGAVFAGGIAMQATPDSPRAIVIAILVAGVLGGMLWAAITALLRDRFNANEILVSLMLVYVAEMVLAYLVYGPWKDPAGYNFPQTVTFANPTKVPRLFDGLRVTIGLVIALVAVAAMTLFLFRLFRGFQALVGGQAPLAARYAGFASRTALWTALLTSGGLAGLAGALEATGPLGQLTPLRAGGLRLRGHHRCLRRPPAPGGHRLVGRADEHVLHRRRAGAVAHAIAEVDHRCVPGPAAFFTVGSGHADSLPAALGVATEGGCMRCEFANVREYACSSSVREQGLGPAGALRDQWLLGESVWQTAGIEPAACRAPQARSPGASRARCPARVLLQQRTAVPRQAVGGCAGVRLCGGEERRVSVGARTRALRQLTHRICSSATNAVSEASYAVRPKPEHRSAVGAPLAPTAAVARQRTPARGLAPASTSALRTFKDRTGPQA